MGANSVDGFYPLFFFFLHLSESEALIKGSGLEGVLEESLSLPVSGPLLGGKAWLLPPAALSSRCPPGSVALTNNREAKKKGGVGPGKEKALPSTVNTSQGCKIFHRPFIGK